MIEYVSIVEIDMVIHTAKTDKMKLVVEIKCFGMSADEFDKETGSSDRSQPKQADLSCVHALIELHLYEIHVFPIMSSDSHATITYTSMSSYEVIVNGYFGMPMDPLDSYAQLIMEVPPSPDYIPGPEAPPLPDYIPGPEYPEYLPPADNVFPAEEQPLPAAVSPTFESPGFITNSEPELEPEEEDGDDEKSEGNFIDYPTNRGDDDDDDEGDDLSEDDADEEESSDSEEEEDEHLAPTVPAPAVHTTPPPFRYRVAARISVRPRIPMPFRSESKIERLLAMPTLPLSPVSPTLYPLPPFLMPLPIFTLLPPPLPIILPRTKASMVLMRSSAPSTFILAPRSRTPPIGTP
nr:hypothetical protein [Tanacetum cinerariifolium]